MERRKVLVIDDEQIVLDSVKKILTSENYDVEVTLSGKKGIKKAVKNSYDIVLTDIRMPDVNGLIVLRDIKREKPAMPIIIITGYGSVRSAVQAMKLGAADYIEKPFDPDEFIKSVSTEIDSAKNQEPEIQLIVNRKEVVKVLELAATDDSFRHNLLNNGADALDDYDLTGPEKLAILTGDIRWIEEQIGPLAQNQKKWLEARLEAEVW